MLSIVEYGSGLLDPDLYLDSEIFFFKLDPNHKEKRFLALKIDLFRTFLRYFNRISNTLGNLIFLFCLEKLIFLILYRKIGWKHLLNVYPAGMTGGERIR